MEASERVEAEAITTEPVFISEVEGIIAPADQEKAEPVIAGSTSAMEAVPLEVQDFLEVPNEPELPDSRVPLPEGVEPLSAGVSSSAGIVAPEVRHHSEVRSEPEAPGPGIEEVTSGSGPAWWEVVGSQEDPILGLRHQIEVCCYVIAIRFGFSEILDFLLTLFAFSSFFLQGSLIAVNSLDKYLHSSQESLLEWKRKSEAQDGELAAARSTITALRARNLELEERSTRHDAELFDALKRQEVLEAKSSEYDQLRSAVDVGQAKIDELTSDVLRLDAANSGLRSEVADLRAKLARSMQSESELQGRSSWMQGVIDEQKGLIAGFKAEVSDLSRNLRSVEAERNSARKGLETAEEQLVLLGEKMAALKKAIEELRDQEKAATQLADHMVEKHREANQLARRYKGQLNMVHVIRNRTWIHGFEWGFETLRAMAADENLKPKVPTIKIEDVRPDPRALGELRLIGAEELPDARSMWSIPPPIARVRLAVRGEPGAGPSNVSRAGGESGSSAGGERGAEPPTGPPTNRSAPSS
jgi:predicted  nucleic acid-binding Zn-ribbon protein